MAKFLAIQPVGSELTLEAGAPVAKSIKAHLTAGACWRRSYYVPETGTLCCLWDAKGKDPMLAVMNKAASDFPTEGPYPIAMDIHLEDFR